MSYIMAFCITRLYDTKVLYICGGGSTSDYCKVQISGSLLDDDSSPLLAFHDPA